MTPKDAEFKIKTWKPQAVVVEELMQPVAGPELKIPSSEGTKSQPDLSDMVATEFLRELALVDIQEDDFTMGKRIKGKESGNIKIKKKALRNQIG